MTKEQILLEVETSKFQPEFNFITDLDTVVNDINKPHEDYFLGLNDKVKNIIQREILFRNSIETFNASISFIDVCNWQRELFEYKTELIFGILNENTEDWENIESVIKFEEYQQKVYNLPNQHINLGLRQTNVKHAQWVPLAPILLEGLKPMCFPISANKVKENCQNSFGFTNQNEVKKYLTKWYNIFQTIRFFEDFNDRLGSIVINVISYLLTEKYLVHSLKDKET
jgi:hypothetical protein